MENPRIIFMDERQDGLDCQMQILRMKPQVYDHRNVKNLNQLKAKDYNPELWFVEGTNQKYPFLEKSEKPGVVSAYFCQGFFHYTRMGERDSDPQYAAVRTSLGDIDRVAEAVAKKGGEKIIIGLAVNPRKTIDFALGNKTRGLEQKVKELMALPKDEQERAIRHLLSYRNGVR